MIKMKNAREHLLFRKLLIETKKTYGKRLVTLAVFGSWAGGRNKPDSDIDILVVAEGLARKRLVRVSEFNRVEGGLKKEIGILKQKGIHSYFSPIFKTPEEVKKGSLIFLDMLYELIILYDRKNFLLNYLRDFKKRLSKLGAKRIKQGERWYWILKPDYQPGESFEI